MISGPLLATLIHVNYQSIKLMVKLSTQLLFVMRHWHCPKNVSGNSEPCINFVLVCVCVHEHVSAYLLLIGLNKDQQQGAAAEAWSRKWETHSRGYWFHTGTEVKEGEREQGWKDVICGLNPNWITPITSLFLDLFSMFFYPHISFKRLPSTCKCFTLEFLQSSSQ